jgi:hypothetical protein
MYILYYHMIVMYISNIYKYILYINPCFASIWQYLKPPSRMTGWCLTYPSEKIYEFVSWVDDSSQLNGKS